LSRDFGTTEWQVICFIGNGMQFRAAPRDITFVCIHCNSPLVVDAAAAGLTLPCQQCKKPTPVPDVSSSEAFETAKVLAHPADLQRRLKENEAQRSEVIGCINQLTIQMHRWKLRLQTLEERRRDLESQLNSQKAG
jgi:transcription elongation factor Elf1